MSYLEAAEDRDRYIGRRVVMLLDELAKLFAEWLQEEIRDLITQLQVIEPTSGGPVLERIREQLERLDDINRRQLEECKRRMKERVSELEAGDSRGLLEDKEYLEERLRMFESMIRELLRVRSFVVADQFNTEPEA